MTVLPIRTRPGLLARPVLAAVLLAGCAAPPRVVAAHHPIHPVRPVAKAPAPGTAPPATAQAKSTPDAPAQAAQAAVAAPVPAPAAETTAAGAAPASAATPVSSSSSGVPMMGFRPMRGQKPAGA